MKRYLSTLVFLSFTLLLCAQPYTDVRTSQDIRYQGNVVTNSAGETWVLWEENAGSGYQIQAQKYNNLGNAAFDSPVIISTGKDPVFLVETVATSDGGVVLLYIQDIEQQVIMKVQKLNFMGQAQWAGNGIFVAPAMSPSRISNTRRQSYVQIIWEALSWFIGAATICMDSSYTV